MSVISLQPILLPSGVDYQKWSVIACDQFSSNPDYWAAREEEIGDAPSTLRLILPEVYLTADNTGKIADCNRNMRAYLEGGLFLEISAGMILVERTTAYGHKRTGIVTSIDLETYTYAPGTVTPIRATEATVPDRLPPRVAMREKAPLEIPHVIMLADDPAGAVFGKIEAGELLYDFDLNGDGGRVVGWAVKNAAEIAELFEASKKESGLLFAVGDGNHSLASAKCHWDKLKIPMTEAERVSHPARYALVEIENIYDSGIVFEPIHRVVFGDVAALEKIGKAAGTAAEQVRALDSYLLEYGKTHRITVDYVHGEDEVQALERTRGAVGYLMPSMPKSELFQIVSCGGVLPKKCFSMGEATEKRYYLECKKI